MSLCRLLTGFVFHGIAPIGTSHKIRGDLQINSNTKSLKPLDSLVVEKVACTQNLWFPIIKSEALLLMTNFDNALLTTRINAV